MAYIIKTLKLINLKKSKENSEKELIYKQNDKIFIFIVILSAIVIAVDYALIIKFINILENI